MKQFFDKIYLWWEYDGKYYHRYLYNGIKNLIYWFPIIWKDRNWDHNYIFNILAHKLKAQAEYIGNRNIHTHSKRDAEIMMTCVRLIEKISNEFYEYEPIDYHESEYNFIPCSDNPGFSKLEIIEKSNRYNEYFAKYPRQYKIALNKTKWPYTEKNDKTIAMWISHQNQKRAQDILFKLINENIKRWWD